MCTDREIHSGQRLHGDDLTDTDLEQWFESEQQGYFRLAEEHYPGESGGTAYPYDLFNSFHGFGALRGLRFGRCLVLGSASGSDVMPLAPQVTEFICVEPAKAWWSASIGGKPASFRAPNIDGSLDLPNDSIDLIVALGVLHHIANVTAVIAELTRVLRPGGRLILREPVSAMGGWWNDRVGLTKNERGLHPSWLRRTVRSVGLVIERERMVIFAPLAKISGKMNFNALGSAPFIWLDWALSELFRWNMHYVRPGFLRKIAAQSTFMILRKPN